MDNNVYTCNKTECANCNIYYTIIYDNTDIYFHNYSWCNNNALNDLSLVYQIFKFSSQSTKQGHNYCFDMPISVQSQPKSLYDQKQNHSKMPKSINVGIESACLKFRM